MIVAELVIIREVNRSKKKKTTFFNNLRNLKSHGTTFVPEKSLLCKHRKLSSNCETAAWNTIGGSPLLNVNNNLLAKHKRTAMDFIS